MKYTVSEIKYDTDGVSPKKLGLPKELKITVPDDIKDSDEVLDYISNEISNKTGYCHDGFVTDPPIND